jgi:GDP-mannose 6-dehydrogenase
MKVCVFGLGYVGAVSAACLAQDGNSVIGVDSNPLKVETILAGRAPVIEPGLDQLVTSGISQGRLSATTDHASAISASEVALVCVGTPSRSNGAIDTGYLENVVHQIAACIADRDDYFVVSVRSTSLPGTTRRLIGLMEETSGKVAGRDFGVCFNPEFLREGSSLSDYYNPPRVVVGGSDPRASAVISELYAHIEAPLLVTDLEHAEMVKYLDNTWHALKVGFANEVGRMARTMGLDSRLLMEAMVMDTKLNISSKYLRPGFAFGGSCLPKDLRALTHQAKHLDIDIPIIDSILASNTRHLEWALDLIVGTGHKRVGLLGLSFKPDTDDLRESPNLALAERLIGKGYEVKIFDPVVQMSNLVGANRDYVLNQIPHISSLLVESLEQVVEHADVLVIGTGHQGFKEVTDVIRPDQILIDLVGFITKESAPEGYIGIGW